MNIRFRRYMRTHRANHLGGLVLPGRYEVRLMVNGRSYKQPLEVAMDPRVDVSNTALAQQLEMERRVDHLVTASYDFYQQAARVRAALADSEKAGTADARQHGSSTVKEFDQKALKIQGAESTGGGGGGAAGKPKPTFALLNRELGSLATTIEGADAAPTPAMQTAYQDYCHDLATTATSWNEFDEDRLGESERSASKTANACGHRFTRYSPGGLQITAIIWQNDISANTGPANAKLRRDGPIAASIASRRARMASKKIFVNVGIRNARETTSPDSATSIECQCVAEDIAKLIRIEIGEFTMLRQRSLG